jgi:peptide/nickel transport system substrate-binding protein
MKKARFIFFGVLAALFAALALPLAAQDADLGPGEGAPIIYPNFGGDPTNLNPLLISDGPSQDIADVIFPSFVKINVHTGSIDPHTAGSIVDSWTISDDGKVYTFTLRDDYTWSDGTPITSADVKYAFDAVKSGELNSPLNGLYDTIDSMETPDDKTVVVTFAEADCSALSTLRTLPPVPAHILEPEIGTDYAAMNDSEFNMNPAVSSGPFAFSNFRPGEQITLIANQSYPDSDGGVIPEGFIQRQLADQTVSVDEFNAGNLTLLDSVPEDRQAEMDAKAASGEVQMTKGLSSGWLFLGFNVADPTNPQDGQDADGNPVDQGHHPLFGDVRVRQAVAYATNHEALNQGAFSGKGIPVASPLLTTSWAYDTDLAPYPYDPEKAMELLDEAGFIDDDNDPATPRVAQGALYAADGTPLSFSITSYSGNTSVDSTLVLMQDQLKQVGFDVKLDVLEFQTMLEKMDGQVFDSIMLFFGGFDASNPDELRSLFASEGDVVNSGFNSSSYYNPQIDELFAEARNLPGCDTEARKALYGQIQQILYDDLPIFYVNTSEVPVVVQPDVRNFDPLPLGFAWNISRWSQVPR